jgi:glycosyltransferase involved in cell wall biosynthesis
VTVHDLVFLRQPEHLTPRGVSFHRRGLALARKEAAAIVVPTAFGKEDLVAEGVPADRIHVAHHGVELPAVPTPIPLGELGIRPPYVLFVGTVEPRKGVTDLLAAFEPLRSSHPDLQLVLAGPPGWGELPDLHRPGIVATGNVGEEVLDALYRSAVALALPSSYEGFGLPVAEAMARGCPVVTSDAACLPEVAGDAGVVVPLGDVDALAGALHRLVVDREHREERVAASLARATAFTWLASAEAHRRAYEAALA